MDCPWFAFIHMFKCGESLFSYLEISLSACVATLEANASFLFSLSSAGFVTLIFSARCLSVETALSFLCECCPLSEVGFYLIDTTGK